MFKWLIIVLVFSGCAHVSPTQLTTLDSRQKQVLYVRPVQSNSSKGRIEFWERKGDHWVRAYATACMLGRQGIAALGQKREGDGHTPQGTFEIKRAFGYASALSTGLNYKQVGNDDYWVDESTSPKYNQWVLSKPTAGSYEVLRRNDGQYAIALVVEYNTQPIVPGFGSAIFVHVWKRYGHPTAGCVSLNERILRKIAARLDVGKKPVIIIERL